METMLFAVFDFLEQRRWLRFTLRLFLLFFVVFAAHLSFDIRGVLFLFFLLLFGILSNFEGGLSSREAYRREQEAFLQELIQAVGKRKGEK